jgi:cellulose synthase/poly-beta-1,6-N-acetylglucosamine synthase-like glycosyltransferase
MKGNPLSIITNFYNESQNIRDYLESMKNQTYKNFELILIDDGSTDNSSRIAERYRDILNIKLFRLKHIGLRGARALGVRKAHGDILVTLDADETLKNDALERIARHFENPSVGAVSGSIRMTGEKWFNRANGIITEWSFQIRRSLPSYRYVFGGCAAYRRKCIESIGGLNPGNISEDIDASWKIMRLGWEVVLDEKIIVWHKEPKSFKAYFRKMLNASRRGASTYLAHRRQTFIAMKHYLPRIPLMFKVQGKARDKMTACFLLFVYSMNMAIGLLGS